MQQAIEIIEFGKQITEPVEPASRAALASTTMHCDLSDHEVPAIPGVLNTPELRPNGINDTDSYMFACPPCLEEVGIDIGSAMKGFLAFSTGERSSIKENYEAEQQRLRKERKDKAREEYFREHPEKDTRLKRKNGNG